MECLNVTVKKEWSESKSDTNCNGVKCLKGK